MHMYSRLLLLLFVQTLVLASPKVSPAESVQRFLGPQDVRVQAMLRLLDRLSAFKTPRMIVSTGDPTQPLDRLLQHWVAHADASSRMISGDIDPSAAHYDRTLYHNGDMQKLLDGFRSTIDLLYISSIPSKMMVRSDDQQARLVLSGIKKMSAQGLILIDGCGVLGGGCRMHEHFLRLSGWKPAFGTAGSGLIVYASRPDLTEPEPSQLNVPLHPTQQIDALQQEARRINERMLEMLRQGILSALFHGLYERSNKRYESMLQVAQLAKDRGARTLVEIGTAGQMTQCEMDGCSTLLLGRLALMLDGQLHSVDTSAAAIAISKTATDEAVLPHVHWHQQGPISWLTAGTVGSIDLLFLGSGQFARLAGLQAALPRLSKTSIIVLDGCGSDSQEECRLANEELKRKGWNPHFHGHQRIYVMAKSPAAPAPAPVVPAPAVPAAPMPRQTFPLPSSQDIDNIFQGIFDGNNRRYPTFRRVIELAVRRGAKTVIETGTSRGGLFNCDGDGCSTAILGRMTRLLGQGARMHTVDISAGNIESARRATTDLASHIDYHVSDSVAFLSGFQGRIDILYLDSYDYDGIEYGPSQQHHLKELQAAWSKLHENSVVFLDDCALSWEGKCKMASRYLIDNGWVLELEGYQRVYIRKGSESLNAGKKTVNQVKAKAVAKSGMTRSSPRRHFRST